MKKKLALLVLIGWLCYLMWPVEINVPHQSQLPRLPNGCEITAVAMALETKGVPADAEELAQIDMKRVPLYTGDPKDAYIGDPEGLGFYCYEKPTAQAANHYLERHGITNVSAKAKHFRPFTYLVYELRQGNPVALWTTIDDRWPEKMPEQAWEHNGKKMVPYKNLHVVTLSGIKGPMAHIEDPERGGRWIGLWELIPYYYALGMRAVVVS